jgi:hypothetical protein
VRLFLIKTNEGMVNMKWRLLSVIVALLIVIPSSFAQTSSGLSGIVHDSTGAVLPGVTVKLTNTEQAIVRSAITNEAGVYQFSFLPSGTYDVEASLPSFKTSIRKGVNVAAAQNLKLDFVMEVTAMSEDVTVTANTEAINAESAQLGAVIDSHAVVETPLAGRIFWSLPTLTAGVLPPVQNSGLGYRGGFNVAGSCEGCNNFVLNGMDNNDNVKTIPNFRPSIDSIQEFNVLTGIFPAEYGYATGGQIVMTTKSGSNELHGSAYDFIRNSNVMTARNFFTPVNQSPNLNRQNFGATFGGPIKKNKTFFFVSYEGLQSHNDVYDQVTIPTPEEIRGDFSAIGKAIKDPNTGNPFQGNIIPQNRITPIAAALLSWYPAPTTPTPFGGIPSLNYNFSAQHTEAYNESSVKLDHSFSDRDSGYVTANWYLNRSVEWSGSSTCNSLSLPTFNCDLSYRSEVYGLTETHIFSPSLVNEAKYSWSISIQPAISRKSNYNFWGPFGISPVVQSLPSLPDFGFPNTSVTGYSGINASGAFKRTDPHMQMGDSLSWTHNKHTTKFGVNWSHFTSNNANVGTENGGLSFSNTSAGPTTGYALSDLLLGLPATTNNQPYVNKIYIRASNYSAYVQDDYRVTSNLTLNLGLRWEMNGAPYEKNGLIINFDRAAGVPVIEGSNPYYIYQPGNFTDALQRDGKEFNPRVGLAWQPFGDGRTVLRLGAGRFLNNLSYYNGLSNIYAAYPVKYTYTSSLATPVLLSNPFPATTASNATLTTAATGADRNFVNARAYEVTAGVQRELKPGLVFDVSFLAKAERHLNQSHNINQPRPGAGTPAQVNARRPYPAWGNISFTQWDGNINYDAMVAKLTQQYQNGLSFNISYTYAHTIDNTGGVTDQLNFRTARGDSQYDLRHRLVLGPVYELPFGAGKPFASSGVVAKIAGGWQLSPLFQWQTGNHLTAVLSGNYSNSGGTQDRPDMISDPNENAPHTPQQWFNTSAFALRPANGAAGATYSFGNAGKGVIVGPSMATLDVSLVRSIQASERVKVQLRFEMFNALNHTNFGFPGLTADGSGFGAISTALDPRQSQFAVKFLF